MYHYTRWGKTTFFFLKIRNKAGITASPLLFNILLHILGSTIKQENKTKGIWNGKDEVKLSSFSDDMIIWRKSFRIYTKTIRINKFIVYSIQDQYTKLMVFLNASNEKSEVEILKQHLKCHEIKQLGINLMKVV